MAKYSRHKQVEGWSVLGFGPFAGLNLRVRMKIQDGWVQKPLTQDPLPYKSTYQYVPHPLRGRMGADSVEVLSHISPGGRFYDPLVVPAKNKAYSRFVAYANGAVRGLNSSSMEGGSTANLALTLLDWRKSAEMISKRGLQLVRAIRALKKFDIPRLARELGVRVKPKTVGRKINGRYYNRRGHRVSRGQVLGKTQADLWLEYSFGWIPLLQDIHDASKVLENTIPADRIRARGQNFMSVASIFWDDDRRNQSYAMVSQIQYTATIRVSNPNLLLLNQLGLANPAHVLWDAVPFSFVVDWILPVGRFVKSFSDFVGLELINPVSSEKQFGVQGGNSFYIPDYSASGGARYFERKLEAPAFKMPNKLQLRPDLWKAVTSSALIVQKVHSSLRSLK